MGRNYLGITPNQSTLLAKLLEIYSVPPLTLLHNPFSSVTRVYEEWRNQQIRTRKEVAARQSKGPRKHLQEMIYPSRGRPREEVHDLDNAAAAAGSRVISDWVDGARLCSQSLWVEHWMKARFEEGAPDVPRWLMMLRAQLKNRDQEKEVEEFRRRFPEPSTDALDTGFMSTYRAPTSKRERASLIREFTKEADIRYERSLLKRSAPASQGAESPGKKAGNYTANHFDWLVLRIYGVSSGLIAVKYKAKANTVNEGAKTCAKLVDICWPLPNLLPTRNSVLKRSK